MSDEMNGWKEWTNKRESKLTKYKNQEVVIVSSGKYGKFYLPDAVMKLLGNPTKVRVFTRGSNIGIMKSDTDAGYAVYTKAQSVLPIVSVKSLIDSHNLKSGAHVAHNESGVIVFDTRQSPSSL